MTIIAKPVIKNKYWIVESEGTKVATIQAIDKGGFAYVHDNTREQFPSINLLKKQYNIIFENKAPKKPAPSHDCYGFPCTGRPYNQVWDVQRRLPIFSKQEKSKSLFCAGYYVIFFNNTWIKEYCPKNITISRYDYHGPFKTKEEQTEAWNKLA